MIKISTFNVNSIKARLPRFLEWVKLSNPDVICLQELKCEEQNFPLEIMLDAGYNSAVYGQKTYNGVGILSKYKIEEVVKGLPNFAIQNQEDPQARYIEALITIKNEVYRIASIYVPNGGGDLLPNQKLEDTQKFQYKIAFFQALSQHISNLSSYDEKQIFCGDFNVAIDAIDIYNPQSFDGNILFHPQERKNMRTILNQGLIDVFRHKNPNITNYSWWDYRGNSYANNKGARIDYILTTPNLLTNIKEVVIEDKNVRDQEKASDHCPVSLILN
ncbi:MAG: exodeoxyribonuclease III [Alphaproteobacteria bacterium]